MSVLSDANFMAQGQGASIILMLVMLAAMYFFMIRPQTKKKKEEDQMRNSLQVGDEVTTIGGIMGRIVNIREDSDFVVVETGSDRSKLKLKRWAISSCDTVKNTADEK